MAKYRDDFYVKKPIKGKVSYYTQASSKSEGTSGVKTASGEPFIDSALTIALRNHGFGGSYVVTNPATGKSVVVRHNDYGPGNKPFSKGVIGDLSLGAFKQLGDPKVGLLDVEIAPYVKKAAILPPLTKQLRRKVQ